MGLSQSDVATLTETLAAGKHPRGWCSPRPPVKWAGKTGKVARLDEPHEGDFVVVRFGHDELPFSSPVRCDCLIVASSAARRPLRLRSRRVREGPSGPPLLTEGNNGDKSDKVRSKESVSVNDQLVCLFRPPHRERLRLPRRGNARQARRRDRS